MAHSSGRDCDLESHICKMSTYLEEMVMDKEKDPKSSASTGQEALGICDFNMQTPTASIPYIPPPEFPMKTAHCSTMASSKSPLVGVSSVFSASENSNPALRFVNPPCPRVRKMGNYKQTEKEPPNTAIDVEATMTDLGLTPDSLTSNEVYRLFSMYDRLSFYIHADYIFENIYEENTLPSTLSASAQTKHAIWSSTKLLRQLRDSLKAHVQLTTDYQGPIEECKLSLEKLQMSIMKLNAFKNCVLEHRRGKFVSPEGRENLQPLMDTMAEVIENVANSRMYIQVIEWAIQERKKEIENVAVNNREEEPAQPVLKAQPLEVPAAKRPAVSRRYIG